MATGDVDRWFEVSRWMAARDGLARVVGLGCLVYVLPIVGQGDEGRALASEARSVAREHGNAVWIAAALQSTGRAVSNIDPARALVAFREAMALTRQERITWLEARTAQEAARLEAIHGDLQTGLDLLDTAIDSFQQSGNPVGLAAALAGLAVFFQDIDEAGTAAVMYGMSTCAGGIIWVMDLATTLDRVRAQLGDRVFDQHVALRHARSQIQRVREREL